jgi:hypothetical protein
MELFAAPTRSEPCFRHEKQNRLAAVRGLVERALPALAGRNAAPRVDIEKNVVFPAVARQPVAQRNRFSVICARMAQKYARHKEEPRDNCASKTSIGSAARIVTKPGVSPLGPSGHGALSDLSP